MSQCIKVPNYEILCRANHVDHGLDALIKAFRPAHEQVQKIFVRKPQYFIKNPDLFLRQRLNFRLQEPRQDQIQFQHAAPRAPAQPFKNPAIRFSHAPQSALLDPQSSLLNRPCHQHCPYLANGERGIGSFGLHIHAIHDRMSAQQPVGIFKVVAAPVGHLVARVGEKTVSREREDGGDS